ncbi:MAG: hypothetical protein JWM46_355 [Candidatus Kaiserbacteria bacterium]|nr:hypothetical protein [Candidatus Kaiserbacteria bacterium]
MKNNIVVSSVVIAVVFAGIGFFSGTKYQAGQTPARGMFAAGAGAGGTTFAGGAGTRAGRGGVTGGAGAVFGTIISKDANGITVQLGGPNATSTNGTATGSKIILVNDSTQISKMAAGSLSDLTIGEGVTASGTTNSDGSVTATMIQIRPVGTAR